MSRPVRALATLALVLLASPALGYVLPGTVAVRRAADDLGKEIGNAAVLGVKVRNEMAPILTDEQRAKIKKTKTEVDESVMSFLDKAAKGE